MHRRSSATPATGIDECVNYNSLWYQLIGAVAGAGIQNKLSLGVVAPVVSPRCPLDGLVEDIFANEVSPPLALTVDSRLCPPPTQLTVGFAATPRDSSFP